MARTALFFLALAAFAQPQPLTREMNDLNWMEFRQWVPARIQTVLLPTGTLEAHGVINNGADNTAPLALARAMAPALNALVAPLIPYGVTGSLDGYAGTFQISESAYRAFAGDVLRGLARQGFQNIIVINGHGGPQTAILNDLAESIGRSERVRTMVTNWWAIGSDITMKVFGEDGGHAGWNETAFVQAIDSKLVRRELYKDSLAVPRPPAATWAAFPFPASIILYQPNQGLVRFDEGRAKDYFDQIAAKMIALVRETIAKWNEAGIYLRHEAKP